MIGEWKTQARRALHGAMAESASYTPPDGSETYPTQAQKDAGLSLTVRWHTKQRIIGERFSEDAAIMEGVNRLIFNREELAALGIDELERLGTITIPSYGKQFRLDTDEGNDGPVTSYWGVVSLADLEP